MTLKGWIVQIQENEWVMSILMWMPIIMVLAIIAYGYYVFIIVYCSTTMESGILMHYHCF